MIVDIPKLIEAGFGSNQLEPIDTIEIDDTIDQAKLNLFLEEKRKSQEYMDALERQFDHLSSFSSVEAVGSLGTGGSFEIRKPKLGEVTQEN